VHGGTESQISNKLNRSNFSLLCFEATEAGSLLLDICAMSHHEITEIRLQWLQNTAKKSLIFLIKYYLVFGTQYLITQQR